MQLDSVRELKAVLTESVLAPLGVETTPKAFALAAGPLPKANEAVRSIALGIAPKGRNDFRLAVRYQRRELEGSKELETIKRRAKGEADVRFIGRVMKSAATPWGQQRQRPLKIGTSVGHFKITAGTLGAFVTPRGGDGKPHILSNNHVLADENRGKIGDAVLQPGAIDGGQNPADKVATLSLVVKLKKTGANPVDCAAALVDDGIEIDARAIRGLGKLAGIGADFLDEGTAVAKLGRTTGLTRGKVTAFELDNVVVGYDIGNLRFDGQIEIEGADDDPFSRGGDSGSLIVTEDRLAVALLFAGGEVGGTNGQGLTFANPIRAVLDALKVGFVS